MYKPYQQGATLIVVLLFLVLITLAGVVAVKKSTSDLRVATNDQINSLLLNSSDTVNQKLECVINCGTSNNAEKTMQDEATGINGVFGYFLGDIGKSNQGQQVIFCYRPRGDLFNLTKTRILNPDGSQLALGSGAVCDVTNAADYSSQRQSVLTQAFVQTTPSDPAKGDFEHLVQGEDSSKTAGLVTQLQISSSSAIPAFSQASDSQINACFNQPSEKIDSCMQAAGVPNKVLIQKADVGLQSMMKICTKAGKNGSDATTAKTALNTCLCGLKYRNDPSGLSDCTTNKEFAPSLS